MKKLCVIVMLALLGCLAAACKVPDKAIENLNVSFYDMQIKIADDLDRVDLQAKISIYNNSADDWDSVKFNLYANAYRKDAPYKAYVKELIKYGGIEVISIKSDGEPLEWELMQNLTTLEVELPSSLKAGERVDVDIEAIIDIPISDLRLGLYDKTLNLGNFYPILAVYENGEFRTDNFTRKGDPFYSEAADYNVRIISAKNLVIAASADDYSETVGEGYKVTNISAKKLRDFALCASYNFKEIQGLVGDTLVRYYYTGANAPESLLEITMGAFSLFSEKIGAYPYKSYSVAEVPFAYGGMEYSGLVYINKNALDKADIIVHETAHQWFGTVVGSDAINHSWLDEALVTFLAEYYYPLKLKGDYNDAKQANTKAFEAFVKMQRLNQPNYSLNMTQSLYSFATNHEYMMLIYVRGGLMFENIYSLLGEKGFIGALKDYFEANKYQNAAPEQLFAAFKKNRKDIQPIVNSWLNDKVITTLAFNSLN
ncbi:MAG: M1 family metallopeptidase [Clostridia bacterium]